jgi:hypothetical protein
MTMKFMYLTKRKAGFTPDQFTCRWRKHGALAMGLKGWRHMLYYLQAEPIRPVPIAGASDQYDAVAIGISDSDEFYNTPSPEDLADNEMMMKDERETFIDIIPPYIMWLTETHLKKGPPGGITAFLYFTDRDKAAAVGDQYKKSDKALRVVLNNVRDDLKMPGMDSRLPFKAVVEVSAIDLATLKTIIEPTDSAPWRKADVAVVTRETIMWDRLN